MRVLVTGGAGYIGSHTIIDLLSQDNIEVISVDNFSNSTPETYKRIESIVGKRVCWENVDLTNRLATSEFFEAYPDIEAIIHFAALKAVGDSVTQPVHYYQNNLNCLLNVLGMAEEYGVRAFIFSSSCTVYGNIKKLPVNEATEISEQESPYGYSKLAGERMIKDFSMANKTCKHIILRYFNPVGAHISGKIGELPIGKPNNLVPRITRVAAGIEDSLTVYGDDYPTRDGTPIRDYVHVSDISRAHVLALKRLLNEKDCPPFDVFNLGSGTGSSVFEIINAFESATGVKLPYKVVERRPGDVDAVYSDSSKAKDVLGWETQHSLSETMLSAWRWQKLLTSISDDDMVPHE